MSVITVNDMLNELIDVLESLFPHSEQERAASPKDVDTVRAALSRSCDRLHASIEERN